MSLERELDEAAGNDVRVERDPERSRTDGTVGFVVHCSPAVAAQMRARLAELGAAFAFETSSARPDQSGASALDVTEAGPGTDRTPRD